MVKILKIIFGSLIIDTLLGLGAAICVVWWIIDNSQNFSGALGFLTFYVAFEIKNKVKLILKAEKDG
jgi:hypothetical protein